MYIRIYVYAHIHTYMHIYICIYLYICMYAQTYTIHNPVFQGSLSLGLTPKDMSPGKEGDFFSIGSPSVSGLRNAPRLSYRQLRFKDRSGFSV